MSRNEWTTLRAAGMNAGDSAQRCVARQQNHTKHGEEQYGSPCRDFLRGERSTFQSGKALLGASAGVAMSYFLTMVITRVLASQVVRLQLYILCHYVCYVLHKKV